MNKELSEVEKEVDRMFSALKLWRHTRAKEEVERLLLSAKRLEEMGFKPLIYKSYTTVGAWNRKFPLPEMEALDDSTGDSGISGHIETEPTTGRSGGTPLSPNNPHSEPRPEVEEDREHASGTPQSGGAKCLAT
jgi:hypothetical protein